MLERVLGFDMRDDEITATEYFSIAKLANYKSIIRDVMGGYDVSEQTRPRFYDLVQFRTADWEWEGSAKVEPNLLELFVQAGGHLMVCGYQPLTQGGPPRDLVIKYPIVLRFEMEGDQDGVYLDQIQTGEYAGGESFLYRDACLTVLDLAYLDNRGRFRGSQQACRVDMMRSNDRTMHTMREALPIDPRFPRLELRYEAAGPGRYFSEPRQGINAELYNPPYFAFCEFSQLAYQSPCFEPIYGMGCLDEDSPTYMAPVAYWSSAYADVLPDVEDGIQARSAFFGFEPYYFDPKQAAEMFEIILFEEWQLPRF
jgi:hypothetical protein